MLYPNDPASALKDPTIAPLFQHYCKHLALWYDLSDSAGHFGKQIPQQALHQPLLFSAVIAFAAIHVSCTTKPSAGRVAERYHGHCVRLLISLQDDDTRLEDGIVLASVCLLRSYEILAEDFDPNRHLSGAYALAAGGNLPAGKTWLWRAAFFNYLREDITFSLINRCPLKMDLDNVVVPMRGADDEDQLNVAALHLANAINTVFVNGRSSRMKASDAERFWVWHSSLPRQFVPYFESDVEDSADTLPVIRMFRDCHVSVLQYCITRMTVLLSVQSDTLEVRDQFHANAVRLCGLAFTAKSPAVMVNSFGPISFVCRYLKNETLQQDLVARLMACRKEIGWPVQRIINDLEAHWASVKSTAPHLQEYVLGRHDLPTTRAV